MAQGSELSFPVVFHTENCAVYSENPTVSSVYLLKPRWHLKANPFLAVHSADEHRMIYSFSNTTSYSIFLFFFSDNIMTDVASKTANDSLVFIHHSHTHKKTHRTDKKYLTNLMGKPVLCQRTFSSVFRAVFFYTVKLDSLTQSVWSPLGHV